MVLIKSQLGERCSIDCQETRSKMGKDPKQTQILGRDGNPIAGAGSTIKIYY